MTLCPEAFVSELVAQNKLALARQAGDEAKHDRVRNAELIRFCRAKGC